MPEIEESAINRENKSKIFLFTAKTKCLTSNFSVHHWLRFSPLRQKKLHGITEKQWALKAVALGLTGSSSNLLAK